MLKYLFFNNICVVLLVSEINVKFYDLVYFYEIVFMGENVDIICYGYNLLY